MNLTGFHIHTHHSLFDGLSLPAEMVKRAKELGYCSLAIADHHSVAGYPEFAKACKEHGIKPIFGIELYLDPKTLEGEPWYAKVKERAKEVGDQRGKSVLHITLYAKSEEGIRQIYQLLGRSYVMDIWGGNKRPVVSWSDVIETAKKGQLVLGTGCLSSPLVRMAVLGLKGELEGLLKELSSMVGEGNIVLEVHNHGIDAEKAAWQQALAGINGELAPRVAALDSHYVLKTDTSAHKLKLFSRGWTKNPGFDGSWYHILDHDEFSSRFSETTRAQSLSVAEEWPEVSLPAFPQPTADIVELAELAFANLERMGLGYNFEYRNRLQHELTIIDRTNRTAAVKLALELVNTARDLGIPLGPGRGSAVGSLTLYVLGVTKIDPIKHNIPFSTWADPARPTPPDIDIDVGASQIDKIRQEFGKRMDEIGLFMAAPAEHKIFGLVAALNEAIRFKGLDIKRITKVETWEQARKRLEDNGVAPDVIEEIGEMARRLEATIQTSTYHASGLMLFPKNAVIPVLTPQPDNAKVPVMPFTGAELEAFGVWKLDVLANTFVERVATVDMKSVNDETREKVWEVIKNPRGKRLFQISADTTASVVEKVKPTSIDELAACIALAKPSVARFVDSYAKNRPASYADIEPIKSVLAPTRGVIIYQDQVIGILTQLGVRPDLAHAIRKQLSKGKQLTPEQEEVLKKAVLPLGERGEMLLRDLKQVLSGGYALNRAHAVAYATLSYETALAYLLDSSNWLQEGRNRDGWLSRHAGTGARGNVVLVRDDEELYTLDPPTTSI